MSDGHYVATVTLNEPTSSLSVQQTKTFCSAWAVNVVHEW
jgi:hypothetical protein